MEAVALAYSPDQTISSYKQIRRKPERKTQTTVPRPSEKLSPTNLVLMNLHNGSGGLFLGSPSYLSSSLSFSLSNVQKQKQQQPQPPLLPLPINNKPCLQNRGLSCPSTNRKTNRNREPNLTSKKPKPFVSTECLVITSTDRLGPEPCDLPDQVLMSVMKPSVASENKEGEKFSGSVFSLSPPPSSLPLPNFFSLRPKLNCNVEVEGIDIGATDNLRRLLRL